MKLSTPMCYLKLFILTFTVRFSKLALLVVKYLDVEHISLTNYTNKVIAYIFPLGIKETFD